MEFLQAYPITAAMIAANVVASVFAFSNRDFYEQNLFRVGNVMRRREYHRIVTSGFLHVNGTHLFLNMFVLYMFGPPLESLLSSGGFLAVYFGSLLGASFWMLVDKRGELNYSAVGASGAVSGVILGFCLFYPFAQLLLFFIVPMPAIVFGIGYIAISFWLSKRDNAMIAHGAHLGGALAGLVLTVLVRPDALGAFIAAIAGG